MWKDPRKLAGFGLVTDGVPNHIGRDADTRLPPPIGEPLQDPDITRRIRKAR